MSCLQTFSLPAKLLQSWPSAICPWCLCVTKVALQARGSRSGTPGVALAAPGSQQGSAWSQTPTGAPFSSSLPAHALYWPHLLLCHQQPRLFLLKYIDIYYFQANFSERNDLTTVWHLWNSNVYVQWMHPKIFCTLCFELQNLYLE